MLSNVSHNGTLSGAGRASGNVALSVSNLGKSYRIAKQGEKHSTLAEAALGKLTGRGSSGHETFWAVKDVSFEVARGKVVGIIGRNGAGKSTLLKLLSRITEPSSGQIDLYGRVGSLLEVGTGFHPELTGRENIFLNGAILGMRRTEIARQFDQIVDFAGTEKFLDTPVKRYSSGMYVRLAFAVAAHLNPEILIVDEVLAVGDAEFQKKCIGKMQEVSHGGGRTVLVVSHNLAVVRGLCDEGILMHSGQLRAHGPIADVLGEYMATGASFTGEWLRDYAIPSAPGGYPEAIRLRNHRGKVSGTLGTGDLFALELDICSTADLSGAQFNVRIVNAEGINLFTTTTSDVPRALVPLPKGRHRLSVSIPGALLLPGEYSVCINAFVPNIVAFDHLENILVFKVENTGTHLFTPGDGRHGVVGPILPWTREPLSEDADVRLAAPALSDTLAAAH